jgi:hypothetical protein
MLSGFARVLTWITRILQFAFAVILVGICSYMIDQYRDGGFNSPREVVLPEVASVLAIAITLLSIFAVFFIGRTLQYLAAFFDFSIFVLYLASVGVLSENFDSDRDENPLYRSLVYVISSDGDDPDYDLLAGLVRLLVACVVIQIILFFFTTLLSLFVASRADDTHHHRRSRHAV